MIDLHVQKYLHTSEGNQTLDIALQIPQGALLAVYGKSGVGKTTLLRMLAGLTAPETGYIRVHGETWLDKKRKINLTPQKRPIALLIQEYALFPNMTVRQNLEYALPDPAEKKWVDELLALTHLTELADRLPRSLSGGQQQRVALSRALARKPRLLLLDEPLSSLDATTRTRLQDEILRLHRLFGLTTVLVSHDRSEIARMADQVVEIDQGKIVRHGTPADVFALLEHSRTIELKGRVRTIAAVQSGWLLTLESGASHHELFFRSENELEKAVSPWKVGDWVAVTLDYAVPSAVQVRTIPDNDP